MGSKSSVVRDQIVGVAVQHLNEVREASKEAALNAQEALLEKAFEQVDGARAWLVDPSKLLGSEGAKHGEFAEIVEVQIRNAYSIVDGNDPVATFEGTTRTGAADFFVDGQAFQSKFYGNISQGLRAFVEHLEKYPDMAQDGGLMFPSDKYETVMRVLNGEETELADKSQRAIREWAGKIEELTGKKFEEAVTPSVSTYSDVQLGVAHDTLDSHEAELEEINSDRQEQIRLDHGPSWAGAAQAAAVAGAVSGVITTGMALYTKAREGKNVFRGEFTTDDWKDVGFAGAKGFGTGAVTGGAIYGLTNYAGMAAPFAAAVVSAGKGLATLSNEYMAGEISSEEYFDLGMCLCAESAIVGLATAAGQTIIPIPVLGGIIGSISGKMMLQLAQGLDAKHTESLKAEMDSFLASLDKTYQRVVDEINAEFDKLGKLTDAAFDFDLNYQLALSASVDLAIAYGVPEEKILRSVSDVDDFMLG
ncbi:hypothetical protein [Vreelandella hamiltonii]|uniref:Uncharacterized protein n=1 Tax=Vreelandella hamiltonii TaxID=502829 RepID=A0A8H9I4R3_9GAMM|nr:hypothetical protein [Halomonas hamiltonii]GGW25592.1 hypothetical protein GCM10007157_17120 [Halomonas hamiltonii]